MATSTRFSSCLLLLFLQCLLFVSSSAQKAERPEKPSPSCDVQSVCYTTPFPDICRQSTSRLSLYGDQELSSVIRGVLGITIGAAKAANLQVNTAAEFVTGSPATGCGRSMSGAVRVLERAMQEVNSLPGPGSPEYLQSVSSIHSLVNKAVADSDACLKVLRGVPGGIGPDKAMGSVAHTLRLSSNLVVFVGKLRDTVKH